MFHSQSTEYRDSSMTKTENLRDVNGRQSSLSADDSADLFCEDSGKLLESEINFQWFLIYFFSTRRFYVLSNTNTGTGR